MLSGSLFNKLNKIAQNIRETREPFGGIQVIVVGDFYQLPVIQNNGKHDFCFKSTTWSECNFKYKFENYYETKIIWNLLICYRIFV